MPIYGELGSDAAAAVSGLAAGRRRIEYMGGANVGGAGGGQRGPGPPPN